MKIKKIVKGIDSCKIYNIEKNMEVQGIVADSRKVSEGYIFVAKKGEKTDGKNFITDALKRKAVAVVSDKKLDNIPLIKVDSIEDFEKKALNNFYDNVSQKMTFIGIAGTKGKTTTSFLVYNYLLERNMDACYIGTIGIYDKDKNRKRNVLTTPDIYSLYELLYKFYMEGHSYCVLEVSSHSLFQKRINGIYFDVAGFTNLSHDHLDYHKNMDSYFETKKRLFSNEKAKKACINADDSYGKKLIKDLNIPVISFGKNNGDVKFSYKKKNNCNGYDIKLNSCILIKTNLEGKFNIYNSVMAALILKEVGVKNKTYNFKTKQIPGRMEFLEKNGIKIYIDYAHSPASLKSVLEELLESKKQRIITVFGCTGDRDKTKRPLMGSIAEKYSDFVVITSDDPHSEDPEDICRDIEKGVSKSDNYIVEVDRKVAIRKALKMSQKNDIVLIAGKGHEKYQIFDGYEVAFNDKQEVLKFFKEKKK